MFSEPITTKSAFVQLTWFLKTNIRLEKPRSSEETFIIKAFAKPSY